MTTQEQEEASAIEAVMRCVEKYGMTRGEAIAFLNLQQCEWLRADVSALLDSVEEINSIVNAMLPSEEADDSDEAGATQ